MCLNAEIMIMFGMFFIQPDSLPGFESLVSRPRSENLTVAIEDLHVRQARLKTKKPRRCSFCKIHGFPITMKGDSYV